MRTNRHATNAVATVVVDKRRRGLVSVPQHPEPMDAGAALTVTHHRGPQDPPLLKINRVLIPTMPIAHNTRIAAQFRASMPPASFKGLLRPLCGRPGTRPTGEATTRGRGRTVVSSSTTAGPHVPSARRTWPGGHGGGGGNWNRTARKLWRKKPRRRYGPKWNTLS